MSTPFPDEIAELALTLHVDPGTGSSPQSALESTLELVLEQVRKALGCGYASIMLVHGHPARRHLEVAAFSDPLIAEFDMVQTTSGTGPDLQAVKDALSVRVDDTRADRRWPAWAAALADAGVRSMLAVRMYTSATTIGTLNLYDDAPDKFDESDEQVAHLLARHAAVALASVRRTESLWQAIDARTQIGQAQGLLMERFDLDPEQAFAVLRRYSQDTNAKLHDVAARLVESRELPS